MAKPVRPARPVRSTPTPPSPPARQSVRVQRPDLSKDAEPLDFSKLRLVIGYKDINDIKPYEWNARDNSKAVAAVANSIRTFGFLIPVVIDSNDVLGAGHTRVEAAKSLGMTDVPFVLADHLTKEQMDAFRIIDNKVAEIADWDTTMLADELAKLDGMFDMTDFGFGQGELDCLSSLVGDDCLATAGLGSLAGQEATGPAARSVRRAPTQARVVIGEITFFVEALAYRNWAQGLRDLHNFNEEDIANDLKQRLGFLE